MTPSTNSVRRRNLTLKMTGKMAPRLVGTLSTFVLLLLTCLPSFSTGGSYQGENEKAPDFDFEREAFVAHTLKINVHATTEECVFQKGTGVFIVTAKNMFLPIERVISVNIYSRISTIPQGSERSE